MSKTPTNKQPAEITVEMDTYPEGSGGLSMMLQTLFHLAEPRLDDEGLHRLSSSALEEASNLASNTGQTLCNIALMVATEEHSPGGAGSLSRGNDVSALLFMLSSTLDTLTGLIEIGSKAEDARHG